MEGGVGAALDDGEDRDDELYLGVIGEEVVLKSNTKPEKSPEDAKFVEASCTEVCVKVLFVGEVMDWLGCMNGEFLIG